MLASAATLLRDIRREPIRYEAVLASGTCVGKMLENKAVVANASNHDRWGDRSASSGCRRGCEMKLWLEASIATVPSCPLAVALWPRWCRCRPQRYQARATTQPPRIRMRLQNRMRAQMRM